MGFCGGCRPFTLLASTFPHHLCWGSFASPFGFQNRDSTIACTPPIELRVPHTPHIPQRTTATHYTHTRFWDGEGAGSVVRSGALLSAWCISEPLLPLCVRNNNWAALLQAARRRLRAARQQRCRCAHHLSHTLSLSLSLSHTHLPTPSPHTHTHTHFTFSRKKSAYLQKLLRFASWCCDCDRRRLVRIYFLNDMVFKR
jgi:hypothetical protein